MVATTEKDGATWYRCEECGMLFDVRSDAEAHEGCDSTTRGDCGCGLRCYSAGIRRGSVRRPVGRSRASRPRAEDGWRTSLSSSHMRATSPADVFDDQQVSGAEGI
ncbi:hypothetical protein C9J85_02170 [Haloferax sp. wsp5]|nr:hypothetical protein C9J85_02170 [Haloferax sp. wsp5]